MSVDEIYAWAVLIACTGLAIGLARKGLAISMIHQTNETVHGSILTGRSELSQATTVERPPHFVPNAGVGITPETLAMDRKQLFFQPK